MPEPKVAKPVAKTKQAPPSPTTPRTSTNEEEYFWVENMSAAKSIFRQGSAGAKESFELERHGYVGSITEVTRRIAYNPYVQRAIQRKKLRLLDNAQAHEVMSNLTVLEDDYDPRQLLIEQLQENASEKGDHYLINLPDEGEPGKAIRAEDIIMEDPNTKTIKRISDAHEQAARTRALQTSGVYDTAGEVDTENIWGPVSRVLSPEESLTEPVREGEWE